MAVIPSAAAKKINRQPRPMRSRRMRKKRKLRALRIERTPTQVLKTRPITESAMAAWTAERISIDRESMPGERMLSGRDYSMKAARDGRLEISEQARQQPDSPRNRSPPRLRRLRRQAAAGR